MNVRSFTMFMSHGASYLTQHQRLYDRLVKSIDNQLSEGLNSLRFREPKQSYYDANSDFHSNSSQSSL